MKTLGFDLDNTILNYEGAVRKFAEINNKFSDCRDIQTLRERAKAFGEWVDVQSWIYTEGIKEANLEETFLSTLELLLENEFEVKIISHKTSYPNSSKYLELNETKNLRSVATKRLEELGLFRMLGLQSLYFCDSIEEKVSKIGSMQPLAFVDDLEKVLKHKMFPHKTLRIYYQPSIERQIKSRHLPLIHISTIDELLGIILK